MVLSIVALNGCQSTSSNNNSTSQQNSGSTAVPSTAGDIPPVVVDELPLPPGSPELGATSEEVIGELDTELDASIAVFDGMILSERKKAEAVVAAMDTGNGSGTEQSGESLFEEGDLSEGLPGYGEFPGTSEDDQAVADPSADDLPSATDSQPETSKKGSPAAGSSTGGVPEDITGGGDDDIVARQIREAALKEKDPVLQEKLWDEYRKYKDQQRTK